MLLHKPLGPEDRDLEALLLISLYQLIATRIPPHAAVDAGVAATRRLGKAWAASLINAVLRRFLREREQLLSRAEHSSAATWLFPEWLLSRLRSAWPDQWQAIVSASNGRAPMTLRVNQHTLTRADYARRLGELGVASRPAPHAPAGLILDRAVPARQLPGFSEGLVSVQDAGAQLAAELLEAAAGERVLDACAAPGGKTAHILERARGDLMLTALDADAKRLERLRENITRLGLSARTLCGDAGDASGEWADAPYQRILLDVPCSATGVIRRHPDIKWLRRDTDIPALAAQQKRLLEAVWLLLAPGGILLYATCSLLPEENEQQMRALLSRHPEAQEVPIRADWGIPRAPGRQTLPVQGGMDGFYYARLEKRAS
jgi:16S rRNA (cytosine967-C5)-methyltransferase